MSTITTEPTSLQGTWELDTTHSAIGFSVVYMGLAPFEAAFTDVSATLDAEGIRGAAQASSIDVGDENLAGHLAAPDFFDTANYPEVRFEGGAFERNGSEVSLEGVLEVKGNKAPITLSGTVTDPVQDPYGNSKLGLRLSGVVDRNQLGLDWNAPLPDGGSMLADDVTLTASLVFVAKNDES
jgi:polyisoprenoid-binding protein YceI